MAPFFYFYRTLVKIYSELFSPNCVSKEAPDSTDWQDAHGMAAIHEKGKKWNESLETMHGATTGKPQVAGNYFTSFMTMDFTPKNGKRMNMEEIGFFEVKDGKIVLESFYY